MPSLHNHQHRGIRTPADILQHASRPQHHSTHLPHHRDWRYATGVFRHEDFDDTSYKGLEQTIWDELDWDTQVGVFGKENRRYAMKKILENKKIEEQQEGRPFEEEEGQELWRAGGTGLDGAVDVEGLGTGDVPSRLEKIEGADGPLGMLKDTTKSTPKKILESVANAKQAKRRLCSRANVVAAFQRSKEQVGESVEEDEMWVQTRLVACLKFSCEGAEDVQRILVKKSTDEETRAATSGSSGVVVSGEPPVNPQSGPATPNLVEPSVLKGTLPRSTAASVHAPDTDRSVRTLAPFERHWIDETTNFNMKEVVGSLRPPDREVPHLSDFFNWFPDAVPVDAIFPPGIPMSAKEILAFYPHHIRWKGITMRLLNNSYLGDTMIAMQSFFRDKDKHPLTTTNVNQFFRDSLKTDIPGFKVSKCKGKPDPNLSTDRLKPSKLISTTRHGFIVPSFDDLLKGLVYLPAGLDARVLTQCLAWYLNVRDTFTPRLELNVLHTQSLIRALRMPLKSYGPQNLDIRALHEWKENGGFVKRRVDSEAYRFEASGVDPLREQLKRSRVTIDLRAETLEVDVVVKLRHVLTFPYLAIGGMVCKALEMGIEKAEARRAVREAQEQSEKSQESEVLGRTEDVEMEGMVEISEPEESGVTKASRQEAALATQQGGKAPEKKTLASMPSGYKIPRKRPLPENDTTADASAKQAPTSFGGASVPLGPRAMSTTERYPARTASHLPMAGNTPISPSSGPSSFYGSAPTPATAFGSRRSSAPNHYHSAPYVSTFSDLLPRDRHSPQTSRHLNTFNNSERRVGTVNSSPPRDARYSAPFQSGSSTHGISKDATFNSGRQD